MSIPSPRFFAPYIYFCKNSDGTKYHVFVKLHLKAGTKEVWGVPNAIGVKCSIIADDQAKADHESFMAFEINPPTTTGQINDWADDYGIDGQVNPLDNSFAITVEYQLPINSNGNDNIQDPKKDYSIIVKYRDAQVDAPALPLQNRVPFLERPYAYLTDINADSQDFIFVPRLAIPLPPGRRIASSDGSDGSNTSKRNYGIYTDVIKLDSANLSSQTIDTNDPQTKYTDSGAVSGYYEASVIVTGADGTTTANHKIKIRNKSSDRRPNSFINTPKDKTTA